MFTCCFAENLIDISILQVVLVQKNYSNKRAKMANQQEVMMPLLMTELGPVYLKKAGLAKRAGPLNRLIFISNLFGKQAGFQPGC